MSHHAGTERPPLINRGYRCMGKELPLNPLIVVRCPYPLADEETEARDYLAVGLKARKQKSRASDPICPLCTPQCQSWPLAKEAAWPCWTEQSWPLYLPCSPGPTFRHPPRTAFCWVLILHCCYFFAMLLMRKQLSKINGFKLYLYVRRVQNKLQNRNTFP